MEELYNSTKEAAEDGIHILSNNNVNVHDPATIKTKDNQGSASNNHAKLRRCSNYKDVGHIRCTYPFTYIQQGEHVDGDNVPESMEHPTVGSPNLETH